MSTQVAQPLLGQFTFPSKNALGVDAFGALAYGYPSPPASNGGSDVDQASLALPADFDFDAFTHCATTHNGLDDPFSLDVDFSQAALCPSVFGHSPASEGSVSTPSSTTLVSPKASISLSTLDILPTPASFDNKSAASFSTLKAPLPSVPVPNAAAAAALELSPYEAEALSNHHLQRYLHYKALAAQAEAEARALALQQSEQQFDALFASFTMPSADAAQKLEEQVPAYQPVQEAASIHHAQAQAHFQAHDAAARLVAQAKTVQPQFVTPAVAAPSVGVPAYAPVAPVAAVEPIMAMSAASSVAPSVATSEHSPRSEGESETDDAGLSSSSSASIDTRLVSVNGLALTNLHGGGRGYVPGKTPDDPEKRHKCQVCGRGFARAFNLKSHIQTHNPLRSKPHQCPHASCRRGFSRLHDLERHRQGIHSDGPLVDAKRKVVSPSSAASASRAQDTKVQNRAEHGSLN